LGKGEGRKALEEEEKKENGEEENIEPVEEEKIRNKKYFYRYVCTSLNKTVSCTPSKSIILMYWV
jgi:hypothetical protein